MKCPSLFPITCDVGCYFYNHSRILQNIYINRLHNLGPVHLDESQPAYRAGWTSLPRSHLIPNSNTKFDFCSCVVYSDHFPQRGCNLSSGHVCRIICHAKFAMQNLPCKAPDCCYSQHFHVTSLRQTFGFSM